MRLGQRIENAFVLLEELLLTSYEYHLDLWIISLDMKKVFNQIEHPDLFHALIEQDVPLQYIHLLAALYHNQTGSLHDSSNVPIMRGVRQGDILSPILFNAGLEMAFRRWHARVQNSGILVDSLHPRIRATRYADDILLYAKSLDELVFMAELLL